METRVTKKIEEAIALLKRGEVVAFPTETVYGLGASIYQPEAIQKVFSIKGRPADNPLIVHVSSVEQALELVEDVGDDFFRLAKAFWPGPLTIVLRRRASVPSIVSAGQPTIAIRWPRHRLAQRILRGVGKPLAAPSANLSGLPSPTTAREVLEDLDGKIPLIVDGGECAIGIESTVVSLVHTPYAILRPGKIGRDALEEVVGEVQVGGGGAILSPGMKYRHYAPRASVRLIFEKADLKGPFILSRKQLSGKQTYPLSAKTLYRQLREADRLGMAEIEIYCDSLVQADAALMDRLTRAAMVHP